MIVRSTVAEGFGRGIVLSFLCLLITKRVISLLSRNMSVCILLETAGKQ